jgi:hypothetical protein
MDRDRLIELLIDDQLEKLGISQGSRRFLQIVEREFRGLNKLSDEELAQEVDRRGIVAEFESPPVPVEEPDNEEEDEEEEDEVRSRLRELQALDDDWIPVRG